MGAGSSLSDDKSSLRRDMANRRDAVSQRDRKAWSAAACAGAADWLSKEGPPSSIMLYAPFRSELDTHPLMAWAWKQEIGVVVPKCYPVDYSMRLFFISDPAQLISGAYGIPEPDEREAEACPDGFVPGAVFVPGLAYDRLGGRLGYGAGYYDRFRAELERVTADSGRPVPPWIGLGYHMQLIERVPMEPHDARLDGLVTERSTHVFADHGGGGLWKKGRV